VGLVLALFAGIAFGAEQKMTCRVTRARCLREFRRGEGFAHSFNAARELFWNNLRRRLRHRHAAACARETLRRRKSSERRTSRRFSSKRYLRLSCGDLVGRLGSERSFWMVVGRS